MFNDPIVAEIHAIRQAQAAAQDYDIQKIVADLQRRQGQDGRQLVRRKRTNLPEQSTAVTITIPANTTIEHFML